MTTHEHDTYEPELETPPLETVSAPDTTERAADVTAERHAPDDAGVTAETSTVQPTPEPADSKALFADNELAGLRARWDSVQAGFVDDPRDCVQQADGLVSDVVKQLTTGFTNARTRLEEQWARGEEASTEDLRVALKQYREFFQRLLAV